jgi:hypothetical protein
MRGVLLTCHNASTAGVSRAAGLRRQEKTGNTCWYDQRGAGLRRMCVDSLLLLCCAVAAGVPSAAARVPSAGARIPSAGRVAAAGAAAGGPRAGAAAAGIAGRPAGKPSPSPSGNGRGGWPY